MTDKRFKQWIGFTKFLAGTVVLGLVTAFINREIQSREVALQELQHLGAFVEHALTENVGTRRRFAQYFAYVTHSDELRARWEEYLHVIDEDYAATQNEKIEKVKREGELRKALAEGKRVEAELGRVRTEISALTAELETQPARRANQGARVRVVAYWHNQGLTEADALSLSRLLRPLGMDVQAYQHVDPDPPDAVFVGAFVGARDARTVLSALPYEVKYLFRLDYPRGAGGADDGRQIGVGYRSTHAKEHSDPRLKPIPVSRDEMSSLLEQGITDTDFQIRLRGLTTPSDVPSGSASGVRPH